MNNLDLALKLKRNSESRAINIKKLDIRRKDKLLKNEEKEYTKKNKKIEKSITSQTNLISESVVNENLFINMGIKYICVSKGLQHFTKIVSLKYNLEELTNYELVDGCIFFGMYDHKDYNNLLTFKGARYIMWGGSDIDISLQLNLHTKYDIITKIKNLGQTVKHLAISESVSKRLNKLNILNTIIYFNLVNNKDYPKISVDIKHNNNNVYIYNGYKPGNENIYGEILYKQVVFNASEFNYILSNTLHIPYNLMFREVYKKIFIGLRLTKEDGNANTVQEMDACGIKVIFNNCINATNTIPFSKSKDIELNLRKEKMEHFMEIIKSQFSSVLFICTDYPSYGGAATNTKILIEYFLANGIKSFGLFIHDKPIKSIDTLYDITTVADWETKYYYYQTKYNFDIVIARNYVSKKIKFNIPIYFLVPGIFSPSLNDYWYNLSDKDINKHINKRIIKTAKRSDRVYSGSLYTQQILKKYDVDSLILSFNYVPFFSLINSNLVNPNIINPNTKALYTFGVIQSDFNRTVKNTSFIYKLIETGEKIILIGDNSKIYSSPNVTCLPRMSYENLLKYYQRIKYTINDSFYESCCNVMLEAKYYGSNAIQNLQYSFKNLNNSFEVKPNILHTLRKPILLVEDNPYSFDDILNLSNYSSKYVVFFIKKQEYTLVNREINVIYCKYDPYYPLIKYYLASKYNNIFVYENNKGVYIPINLTSENEYMMLSDDKNNVNKKYIEKNKILHKLFIDSNDLEYRELVRDSSFMNTILQLCFCCDRNYIMGLIVAIKSIESNTQHSDKIIFNVCVPKEDLQYMMKIFEFYNLYHLSIIFITFDNDDSLNNLEVIKSGGHLKSIGNFIRLNIGNIFKTNRLIYIDSDLVFNKDIFNLTYLKIFSKKNVISGIMSDTDFGTIINPSHHGKLDKIALDSVNLSKKIINTGIYVLNCVMWSKLKISEKVNNILSYHKTTEGGLFRCFTMSLLNLALHDRTEYFLFHNIVIDLGWKTIDPSLLDADVLDWSGNGKPWIFETGKYCSVWDKYFLRLEPKFKTSQAILTKSRVSQNKKVYVIISRALDSIGGAQNFIKYIVNNVENCIFLVFHSYKNVFNLSNVYEFEFDYNLIYTVCRNLRIDSIIFNNSNWLFNNNINLLNWLLMKSNIKVIVHNEFSPAIKFILANSDKIWEVICVNKKIEQKMPKMNCKLIYPITFNLVGEYEKNYSNITFAYVGRLCKYKFIEPLVESFKKISSKFTKLFITDSTVNYPGIKSICNGNMEILYKKINYLFLTSVTEGMPCVILEALNNGIPIISTNVGGVSEIIIDGYNGFLIDVPFIAKYNSTLTMDNFDLLLDEFKANDNFNYVKKKLDDIIMRIENMTEDEHRNMSKNCFKSIANVYKNNNERIRGL